MISEKTVMMTPDSLVAQFDAFLNEAHRLKSLYASQITLLVGLETEYITPLDLDRLEVFLSGGEKSIDYIVGSVHHVNGIPIDFDLPTFRRSVDSCREDDSRSGDSGSNDTSPDSHHRHHRFLSAYFDAQYDLLRRFHPEIVGHIDLCRLYTPDLRFRDHDDDNEGGTYHPWEKLERNIRFAIGYGALFEVNAAAFRKGWVTPYPGEDVVHASLFIILFPFFFQRRNTFPFQLILQHGGRFALSDDSHGPHAVGLNYARAAEYLRRMGVLELWFLQPSSPPSPAGRNVHAVKVDGRWWEHSFWDTRLE
jgi:histidinol-phosphatase (PHP family)